MTLIELLAGLVVLGTVLASVTIARGRFLRQWSDAERRIQATRAADELMAHWHSGVVESIPVPASGPLPGMKQHVWRTSPRRDPAVEAMGASIVRLEVFDRAETVSIAEKPMISLEFLVPKPTEVRR
jgi:hypothetical protein